jgi:2-methylcitrate dehydratase PrpD
VIGRDARLPPSDAALLNAFAARRHTFDDTLEAGPIHPGSTVWAASLAAAEHSDADLSRAMLGALCGYELAIRLANLLGPGHYDAGHHGTGTCNAPASGLAAAVALGLDRPRIAHAVSLAAGAAAGTRQYQIDGSISHSALNAARAAEAGTRSALYAAAGFDAPAGQLDGKWGFLGLFGGDAGGFDDLGSVWAVRRLGVKPYPTCRFTHGPIAALDGLRAQHSLTAGDIETIELHTFAQSISVSDRPDWDGREGALLSHQFALAATLAERPPELATLDRLAGDEHVRALAGRIAVSHDKALDDRRPGDWPHLLRVHLRDGTALQADSWAPPGEADTPEIRGKAERLLGAERLAALEAMLADPAAHATREFTRLLRPC